MGWGCLAREGLSAVLSRVQQLVEGVLRRGLRETHLMRFTVRILIQLVMRDISMGIILE